MKWDGALLTVIVSNYQVQLKSNGGDLRPGGPSLCGLAWPGREFSTSEQHQRVCKMSQGATLQRC